MRKIDAIKMAVDNPGLKITVDGGSKDIHIYYCKSNSRLMHSLGNEYFFAGGSLEDDSWKIYEEPTTRAEEARKEAMAEFSEQILKATREMFDKIKEDL